MAETPQTFSESWYRIADKRISLRSSLNVRRQNFRGERWIIIENPFSNQFFRLRPAAYEFVARLRPDRTVEEVWKECIERFPDQAPGQEQVIQLLSQLYHANLLQYANPSDSAQLFGRFERVKQREIRSRWLNIMFMRFALWDPDDFLNRTIGFVGKLISPFGALLWLVFVGWGLKLAFENWSQLMEQSEGVLSSANIPVLYVGLVLIKLLHELGHAYFCKKYGGEVHVMGVLLMIFTPTPYVDASSSWGFRSRRQRVMVGAAGMIVEVFVASIAMMIWANTSRGLLHNLCYNMVFIASVSTVLFNVIPLLRFDGYYILSDLLDIPNLAQRSNAQLRHLVERYLFAVRKSESPGNSQREKWWLTAFGISSGVYRVLVFGRILLFVADRLLLIGIVMAAICAISWVAVPIGKLFRYLSSDPVLERRRARAIGVTVAFAALVFILLQVVPFSHHFRAPGVIRAKEWMQVVNDAPGNLAELKVRPGDRVTKGQPLLQLQNADLDLQLAAAMAAKSETEARLLQAMRSESANLKPLRGRMESIEKRISRIRADIDALTLRAPQAGVWVAPSAEDGVGRWLKRGTSLGLIVDPSSFEFVATVLQDDVDPLFHGKIHGIQIRLIGQADQNVKADNLSRIPSEKRTLPSPALGWGGGGEVPISKQDPQGQRAAEPFFEVRADVQANSDVALLHGRAGKIRFELESEPILPRGARRFRQLLQRRYQI